MSYLLNTKKNNEKFNLFYIYATSKISMLWWHCILISTYLGFENGVILYGGQWWSLVILDQQLFENGVILYGGQCFINGNGDMFVFENGVILYGGQWCSKTL